MNSGDEAGPTATGDRDELLTRAFERVARLGIDIDEAIDGDELSEREAAAVRAFTALHADTATPAPGSVAEPEPEAAGTGSHGEAGAGAAVPPAPDTVAGTAPSVTDPVDEGPLRPDAVLHSRGFARREHAFDEVRTESTDVIDVDIPPYAPGRDRTAGDAHSRGPAAAATAATTATAEQAWGSATGTGPGTGTTGVHDGTATAAAAPADTGTTGLDHGAPPAASAPATGTTGVHDGPVTASSARAGTGTTGLDDGPATAAAASAASATTGFDHGGTAAAAVRGAAGPTGLDDGPSTAPAARPAAAPAPGATGPAPTATTEAAPDSAAFDPPARRGHGYLLYAAGFGVASGAFVSPWVWVFVVAMVTLVAAIVTSFVTHGFRVGTLARRALRRGLSWLHPRAVWACAVIAARVAVLTVVVPGVVCAAWWAATEGTDGAFVAGRIGVWTYAPRLAAVLTCFVLVVGVDEARRRRIARMRDLTGRVSTTAVLMAACGVLAIAVGTVALVPRSDGGRLAAADGLGWLPGRLRDNVDRVRDDVVSAELHASSECLADRQDLNWTVSYTADNSLDSDDVARLVLKEGLPSTAQLATATAALHNQLAPWVEGIEIAAAGATVVELDRSVLPSTQPVVDPADLVTGAGEGREPVADGADGFDREVALACASALLP